MRIGARLLVAAGVGLGLGTGSLFDASFARAATPVPDGTIAARLDGTPIRITELDARSPALTADVRARLTALARETVRQLGQRRAATDSRATPSAPSAAGEPSRLTSEPPIEIRIPPAVELERPVAAERVVGRVGLIAITGGELEAAAALKLYRLRGELHLERKRQLDAVIDERLLAAEARRRGQTPAQLDASLAKEAALSDAELDEFVQRERAAGRDVDATRARPYLQFRKRHEQRAALLKRLRAHAELRVELTAPARPTFPVDTRDGIVLGEPAANARTLVVYTNYLCETCRAVHRELDRLLARPNARQIRIVLRDFMTRVDRDALDAAALVRCAADQRAAARVRSLVLASPAVPSIDAVATAARLDAARLSECSQSRATRERIDRDTAAALALGFDEPPAFLAAGVPLSGMQSAEVLESALASARN